MNDEVMLIPWASLIGVVPGMFVPALIFVLTWREMLPLPESRWWFLLSLAVWFGMTMGLFGLRCFTFDSRSWLAALVGPQLHDAIAFTSLMAAIWGNGLSTPVSAGLVLMSFARQPENDGFRRGLLVLFASWCAGWLVWSICLLGPKLPYLELNDVLGWQLSNLVAEYVMIPFPNWGSAVGWLICYAALRRGVP